MTPAILLKKYFGYDEFKDGQLETIEQILKGEDTLSIMPTGAGKSVCFQIPAMLLDGITLVISPLISLMKDQVDSLNITGIKAEFLNSALTQLEQRQIMAAVKNGYIKILYIAPERLESEDFKRFLSSIDIGFVAVDEAHCVSGWGHDFRPSYLLISKFVESLAKKPRYSAFTATATPYVKTDIVNLLGLNNPYIIQTGFDRPNLFYSVLKPKSKYNALLKIVEEEAASNHSLLVYTSTRKHADTVCDKLLKAGKKIVKYHAGMADYERASGQDAFLNDKAEIMVATNAFGMGIDKSNIRHVVHYNMPKDLESYYQEAGRGGRDGLPAKCTLLFSPSDIVTARFLINQGDAEDKLPAFKKLNQISDYCSTSKCLRKFILEYFGESISENCLNCGNCAGGKLADITIEAQKILSCVKRTGERFGKAMICDVLRGSKSEKIAYLNFDKLSTYNIMPQYRKDDIREMIDFLTAEGYLIQTFSEYPILRLAPKAIAVLKGSDAVYMKRVIVFEAADSKKSKKPFVSDESSELFALLRSLRLEISKKENVPPFVVFSDKSLVDMCAKKPINRADFLEVLGVGEFKADKYGKKFIDVISKYVFDNGLG